MYINGAPLIGSISSFSVSKIVSVLVDGGLAVMYEFLLARTKRPGVAVGYWSLLYLVISQIQLELDVRIAFSRSELLPEDHLDSSLQLLLMETKFPLESIRVGKGDFSALFIQSATKSVVLVSEGIERKRRDQLSAIIAHELGHWRYRHNLIDIIIECLFRLSNARLALWLTSTTFYHSLDLIDEPAIIAYDFGLLFVSIFRGIIEPLRLYMKRSFEYCADAYASAAGFKIPLGEFLTTIMRENNPIEHGLVYSFFYQTHPSLRQRIDRLAKI